MIHRLKKLKFKTAPTLNNFIKKVDNINDIKAYVSFLDKIPKRTDFINFDEDGFELNDNKPLFKGWSVCQEASNDTIKVAKKGDNRIYFDTKDGVIIVSHTNMCDNATYNELFIFFDNNLQLN